MFVYFNPWKHFAYVLDFVYFDLWKCFSFAYLNLSKMFANVLVFVHFNFCVFHRSETFVIVPKYSRYLSMF